MNAKARVEPRQSLLFKPAVDDFIGVLGLQRCTASAFAMVGLRVGRVPECHHGIADKFVDRAAMGNDDVRQRRKIAGRLRRGRFLRLLGRLGCPASAL